MFQDRLQALLVPALQSAFSQLFGKELDARSIGFQATRPEFEGDVTINVFPFIKLSGKGPEQTAQAIGEHVQANVAVVERFNVVKGFLNIVIADSYWLGFMAEAGEKDILGFPATGKRVMVEYASPNTNKPLHLGHLRNIFLGYSVSRILQAAGNEVIKVQVINDRGIHICKSMIAWQNSAVQRNGNGETPASAGVKGDKLVGKYYVEFDKEYRQELQRIKQQAAQALEDSRVRAVLTKGPTAVSAVETIAGALAIGATAALIIRAINLKKPELDLGRDEELTSLALGASAAMHHANFLKNSREERLKTWIEAEKILVRAQGEEIKDELLKKSKAYGSIPLEQQALFDKLYEEMKDSSPIIREAQEMLRKWEANDPEVRALWEKMNGWCYEGFDATYARAGVDFDKNYYESQTYVLGKNDVLEGLKKGVFYEKDGAVWVDNTKEGLDEKVLLRRDGTSVYMTQDIGTAIKRFEEYPGLSKLIYTVGNEQDYHFKVLFIILKKLGFAWADELFHLSYGMVDLPSGKMKSREGTVVDADDIIDEVVSEARRMGEELSKLDDLSDAEKAALYEMIGLAALKYFLLKVDPKKRMLFDPAASIDLQGHTGPFIQYTYARIKSLLRKAGGSDDPKIRQSDNVPTAGALLPEERTVIKLLHLFPAVLNEAATKLDPSSLANHAYELVKAYNSFYQAIPVMKEEDARKRAFRLALSAAVAAATKKAMWCLGIEVPERM